MSRTGTTISPLFTNDTLQLPSLGGSGVRCVQVDNSGNLGKAVAACGSGGGGGGSGSSTWSTTTSNVANQNINYSNLTTDIVVIGNTATTSAPFYFDPNTRTSLLNGLITTNRITATGTTASSFVNASSTSFTSSQSSWFAVSSGSVGIGTAAPSEKLTVSGSGGTRILLTDSSSFAALRINSTGDTASLDYAHGGVSKWGSGLNGSSDSYNIWDASQSNQNIITIPQGNGLVGFGTSTPSQVLSVQGNGLFSGNVVMASLTASGTVSFANALTVANGGTGAKTLTGCLTGNGTGAITGSGTCNTSNATVSSVATNNGLTGGTITTSGTIGFDLTKLPVNNLILTYNGSQLTATGTKDNLTVPGITATSTASSTFAGGVDAARVCLTGTTTCLGGAGGGSGTVTSVATNNGLTGGTITTSGTIGLDLSALPVSNTVLTWNGSKLTATGTNSLAADRFIATSTTATSSFAGGITGPNNFIVQQNSGWVGIASSSPMSALSVVGTTTMQGDLLLGTTGSLALGVNYNGTVSIGTTTSSGAINIGTDASSASTTMIMGKIQFDGYDTSGNRRCIELLTITAGAPVWTGTSGACTP